MSVLKTIVSLVLSLIMMLSNSISASMPSKAPDPKSESELYAAEDIIRNYPLSEEITVIRRSKLSSAELRTVISLQGIVAKTTPSIYIDYSGASYDYAVKAMENAGYTISRYDENGDEWNFSSVIKKFSSYITDSGYVLYSTIDDHGQINTATNISTLNGWLSVPAAVEESVKALGLTKKQDISGDNIDIAYLRSFYNEHKDKFRKDMLIHQKSDAYGLRDLAIQQNAFVMYVDDSDIVGRAFRDEVFSDLEPASLVLGWCQYEVKFTKRVSSFGHYVIPSDHSFNVSILASFEACDGNLGNNKTEAVELDPTKHYIAIVYSDGDNAQWIQNGYNEFYTWQSYDIETPITWTFPPLLTQMSTVDIKRTAENAGDDSFITGPTGAGYARISQMDSEALEAYSDLTASLMLKTGMTTMTLLDEAPDKISKKAFETKLGYFARYSNIYGGIMQLDPDRYSAGKGEVYFVNEKPFVSVKLSLWHPSGNADEVTKEWLKEQADTVNSYSADINSINGYSVINVHPWTVGPDDLAYFVSCLDDDVVVISGDKMIAALTQNIPHQNAKPE